MLRLCELEQMDEMNILVFGTKEQNQTCVTD